MNETGSIITFSGVTPFPIRYAQTLPKSLPVV
jgi:hypothetical protein